MTTRVIDGPCPICGGEGSQIVKITPDPDHPEVFYFQCTTCGYNESQSPDGIEGMFPSHIE